jgi:hypothetical protein
VLLYLAAVFVCYILQAAYVWYYTIPFIPVIAILAGSGAATVFSKGIGGTVAVISILVLWLMTHIRWSWGTTLEQLNRWTWSPHPYMPERNFALDGAAEAIRTIVRGESMLVYGHYTQAYTLVGCSYPIRFIAPNDWLNIMAPDWQNELLQAIADLPPSYILDTDGNFEPVQIQERVGLKYDFVREFPGEFRLFRRVNESPSQAVVSSRSEAMATHFRVTGPAG